MMEKSEHFEKNFSLDGWVIALIILTIIILAVVLREKPEETQMVSESLVSQSAAESKTTLAPSASPRPVVKKTAKKTAPLAKSPVPNQPNAAPPAQKNPTPHRLSRDEYTRLRSIINGEM